MNPLTVFTSIFGVGTIAGGSVGGYFFHLNAQDKNKTTSNPPL